MSSPSGQTRGPAARLFRSTSFRFLLACLVAAILAQPTVPTVASPARVFGSDPTVLTALARAVNTDRMFADLGTLSTGLRTRSSTTPQFGTACQYGLGVFRALGLSASLDPFTGSGHTINNVVAVKLGTVYPSQIIIIGAHLDSTSTSPATLAPGAEDNGSGAVAVLEAARLLAGLPSERTIHFILFGGEEQGELGSAHYAAQAAAQKLNILAVLTMDMIGYNDPAGVDLWIEGFHQGTSSVALMNQLDVNARTYGGLKTYLYPGEGSDSDHEPFHQQGFPAILAIENEWDSYPCYHQTCDTVDKLDAGLMRKITGSVVVTAADLAGVTASPGSVSGSVTIVGGGSPAGAVVSLSGTGWSSTTVGASGQFTFPNLLPADYTVVVTKADCVSSSVAVTVSAGSAKTVTVALTRAGGAIFTDDPLMVGTTPVKAAHITELRQAIAALRVRYGLDPSNWTDASLVAGVTPVQAVHLTELRSSLKAVYTAAGRAVPTYTHATLTGGATVISAMDISELRVAVLALW
jgi:hypothetical protein